MSSTAASTSNFQLILDALDDYTKQTGIDLKNPFAEILQNCDSPDSILQQLQDKARAFKDYRDGNHKLINWLSPVVKVLHTFSGVLSEAAGVVPFQPAKLIVVGIDTLLTAAIGVTASYDALVDLFECVANFLNRLRVYAEIPFTPTMTSIIVKILVEVLSVLALATKQVKQGRFRKFAKKLLGESEIEAVVQRLDRLTQEEARMTVAQTLEVVHGLVKNMKVVMDDGRASTDQIRQALVAMEETTSEINKMKRDQLQRDIRSWLSPPDSSKNHNIARAARHDGTSAWFTQGSIFEEWNRTGSLLWVHGKPGSGKSILCSTIIQEAKERRNKGLALMGYFYCDFRDTAKQDVRGLLSSLLAQFCAKSDSCYDILSELYSAHDVGSQQPDDDELMECLKKMLKLPEQPTMYIIVDGLDECPNTSGLPTARERVLDLLEDLVTLNLPHLRICVTSRPEFDIKIVLEPLASLHVSLHDENGQKSDIRDYVSTIVRSDRKMRRWRAEDKQLVIDTLCAKVNGMFRWVFCQLEMLRRCSPPAIRRALLELPESLDETYGHTLLGIEKEQRDYAHRLFQCMTVAIRPLRVEELAEVLAIRFDAEQLPEYHVDWRSEEPQEAVLRACSTLITVVNVEGSQVVQFSHFSVKEFLTSDRLAIATESLSRYYILPHFAHTILAQACLSVLLHLGDQVDKNMMENFPLAVYAAEHWVDHAQFEDVSSRIEDQMECLFDSSKPHFATWVWIHDIDYPFREPMFGTHPTPPEAIPLYYATHCGFGGLIERLVKAHPGDVNTRGGFYVTALHAAVAKGYMNIALLLLKHGADTNALDGEKWSPLHRASRAGRREMAELLLENHADVDVQNGYGGTPLYEASRNGELEVVRVLLRHGSAVDSRDNGGGTPLIVASRNGHLAVVQLLLQRGAALDSSNNEGWTSFMSASRYGHLPVVRFLLQGGASVDSSNNEGWTPLKSASRHGHLPVVRLLLQSGASVDSSTNEGSTPLMSASRYGHLEIVQELLDHGADANAQKKNLWTPLHLASANGNLEIAQLLARCGAAVDMKNQKGESPLYLACGMGNLEITRLLIERGADVNSCDDNGWIPYHTASCNGHLDVVHLLLEHVTDVDVRTGDHRTPLALASQNGKLEVSRFLIERGADVNCRDEDGWTTLHFASDSGHLEAVRLLLDHGADVNSQEANLWTPLHLASANGHLGVAELLVERGAEIDKRNKNEETPLDKASGNGQLEIARLLVKCGSNTNSRDSNGWTPLHTAAGNGHLDIVTLLLDSGADVHLQNSNDKTPLDLASGNGKLGVAMFLAERTGRQFDGISPNVLPDLVQSSLDNVEDTTSSVNEKISLHTVSETGNLDVIQSLLDHGADVNERNGEHQTPLDVAAAEGKLEVAMLLIKNGADVNCRDKAGWTPLHDASRFGHLGVVRLLLDHGANVHAKMPNHWTPLHLAVERGYLEIVKLLLEGGANVRMRNDDGHTPLQLALKDGEREMARLLSGYGTHGV